MATERAVAVVSPPMYQVRFSTTFEMYKLKMKETNRERASNVLHLVPQPL